MIDEEPDAAALYAQKEIERPIKAVLDDDLERYRTAWIELQHDRFIGDMGGTGGIYYTAISRYGRDHFIGPDEFDVFHALIRAQDAEYLAWLGEKRKEQADDEELKRRTGAG